MTYTTRVRTLRKYAARITEHRNLDYGAAVKDVGTRLARAAERLQLDGVTIMLTFNDFAVSEELARKVKGIHNPHLNLDSEGTYQFLENLMYEAALNHPRISPF